MSRQSKTFKVGAGIATLCAAASIGVAVTATHAPSIQDRYAQADRACDQALSDDSDKLSVVYDMHGSALLGGYDPTDHANDAMMRLCAEREALWRGVADPRILAVIDDAWKLEEDAASGASATAAAHREMSHVYMQLDVLKLQTGQRVDYEAELPPFGQVVMPFATFEPSKQIKKPDGDEHDFDLEDDLVETPQFAAWHRDAMREELKQHQALRVTQHQVVDQVNAAHAASVRSHQALRVLVFGVLLGLLIMAASVVPSVVRVIRRRFTRSAGVSPQPADVEKIALDDADRLTFSGSQTT